MPAKKATKKSKKTSTGTSKKGARKKSTTGKVKDDKADLTVKKKTVKKKAPAAKKSTSTSLSRLDPFSRYMAEISRYDLLTRDEEKSLAVKYQETGDVKAAYQLVTANLRLVVKIAMEYRRSYANILDLIQEGNIGLMQAVKKFDPFRGVKLSSYSAWWIRAYIIRYILNNLRMVKIGTTEAQRKLFFNLRKEKEKLEAAGYEITPKLIATNLDVSERDVIEMDQMLSGRDLSLDVPVEEDSDSNLMNILPSSTTTIEEDVANGEFIDLFRAKIKEFSTQLNEKELAILNERLLSESPKTLEQIGNMFGISRERVRQLETRIRTKLKAYIRETVPDFEDQVH
jgi:RNA polymerase sigma-32 factor